MSEYDELACQIVDGDHDYIGNNLDYHIVHMQHVHEQSHTEKINQFCADTKGKERDNLFHNSLCCVCFTVEHPLPVRQISKQHRKEPCDQCGCQYRHTQRMRAQQVNADIDQRRQHAEHGIRKQILIFFKQLLNHDPLCHPDP